MKYRFEKYNLYDGAHQYFDKRIVFLALTALAFALITTFGIMNNRNDRSSPAVGTSQNDDSEEQNEDSQAQNTNGDQPAAASPPDPNALGAQQQPAATQGQVGGRGGGSAGSTSGGSGGGPTPTASGSPAPTGGRGGGGTTSTAPPSTGGSGGGSGCILNKIDQPICNCSKLDPTGVRCIMDSLGNAI